MNTKEMQSIHFSAQTIGNSQDILTDLLLLIPAKPFLKFKSVSKTITSAISDPEFCLSQTQPRPHTSRTLQKALYWIISMYLGSK
jgi:hypothetical protein